jgi:hypothetical protein
MRVMVHTGGASIPGSGVIGPDFVVAVRPDVAGHVNGGPTSLSLDDVERILDETDARIELVHNGNITMLGRIAARVRERGELHRIVIGTDSPAGSGVQPLGILRVIASVASLGGVDGAVAVAAAWLLRRGSKLGARAESVPLRNPFSLTAAAKFAAFFALVLLVVELVKTYAPGRGGEHARKLLFPSEQAGAGPGDASAALAADVAAGALLYCAAIAIVSPATLRDLSTLWRAARGRIDPAPPAGSPAVH